MKIWWPTLICLFFFTSTYADEISIVGGAAPTEDLELDLSDVDLELDQFSLFGLRYEKEFFLIVGWEHSLIFANGLLASPGNDGENGLYYTSNLVLNLPVAEQVVPNIALGVGFMQRFGDSFPDIGSSFLTNFGAGLKLRNIGGPLGLRIDYRRLQIYGVEDTTLTAQEISGGLVFSF